MGFQYLLHVIILLLDIRQSIEIIIFHFQITFWWCSSIHFKSVIESKMMTMKMGMGKMMTAVAVKKYVELEAWAVPLFYLSFPNSTNKQTPRIVTLCKQFVFMIMMMMMMTMMVMMIMMMMMVLSVILRKRKMMMIILDRHIPSQNKERI